MEFVYDRVVNAPISDVWNVLTDPSAMEPHLPGSAKAVVSGPDAYRVSMKISMGFLRPTVNADVQLSNLEENDSLSFELSGKSMGAGVAGSAEVALTAVGENNVESTRIRMTGSVETSGLLKKIDDTKIEAAATGFLESYFESVERAARSI